MLITDSLTVIIILTFGSCPVSCGGCVFDKHEGHLSSPGYPKPSSPFLSCKYIISVEPRFIVTLNFRDNFHIDNKDNQHGSSCQGHFLQVTTRGTHRD